MELSGKRVLVFGAGRSGQGAASLLLAAGASPVLYDGNENLTEDKVRSQLPDDVKGIRIVTGELTQELIENSELCVISPGVPTDIAPVNRIRSAGVKIWSEVELAWQCSKGETVAVTGTNGKTTTVSLLGDLMKRFAGAENTHVVGNIGYPYTKAALQTDENAVCVAEVSSFQLETIDAFHPHVSVITNITPDHLNRHHTMEEYIRVKERICENQTPEDIMILNYEDEVLRQFGENIPAQGPQVWWFSSARTLEKGMYLDGDVLKYSDGSAAVDVIHIDELRILGKHNYENVSAAVLSALAMGMPLDQIQEVLRAFPGVEHRIEYVGEVNGVAYYNDSKGTNVDATITALDSFEKNVILLVGGFEKGLDVTPLREHLGCVRKIIGYGLSGPRIANDLCEDPLIVDDLVQAVREAHAMAVPGDIVLLSPTTSSFDQYTGYEQRGKHFKELVNSL